MLLGERPTAHEPRLVASLDSPVLFEQEDLQRPAGYEVGQLTLLEQELRAGPVMALEVAQGRLAEDEDTTALESLRHRRQNCAIEEMVDEDDIPWSAHQAIGLQIPPHRGQGDSLVRRQSLGVIQRYLRNVNESHLQPTLGEPHGVPSRASSDVEGAARARNEPTRLDHERGRLGAPRTLRPATVPSRRGTRCRIDCHHVSNGTGDGYASSSIALWVDRSVAAGNLAPRSPPETI